MSGDVFRAYTDRVQPLSLDEAFLDVTESADGYKSPIELGQAIKRDVLKALLPIAAVVTFFAALFLLLLWLVQNA